VVLPIAAVSEKPGTFVNWEGRPGSFEVALPVPSVRSDLHVLNVLADEMDVHLGLPDVAAARRELNGLGGIGRRTDRDVPVSSGAAAPASATGYISTPGHALLATWPSLLDAGRMQDGEPNLAGTARQAVAKMSAATAAEAGAGDGDKVTVATDRGAITVPVQIADMPDRVVWLPTNSAGCAVRGTLGVGHGSLVTVRSVQ
jgi:NADH-quinone oxidoreductase subunit G